MNHTTYRWARLWGDSWRYVVEARNHEGTPIYRAIAVTDDFGRSVGVRRMKHQLIKPRELLAIVLLAAAVVGACWWAMIEQQKLFDVYQAEANTSWIAFNKRMTDAGCKTTEFVATRYAVRAVWRCPDGTAHLGREQ